MTLFALMQIAFFTASANADGLGQDYFLSGTSSPTVQPIFINQGIYQEAYSAHAPAAPPIDNGLSVNQLPASTLPTDYIQSPELQVTSGPGSRVVSNSIPGNFSSVLPGLAQRKAKRAAQGGIRGHLGGGLGGAKYEGVGWSNQSAQRAIESCCYWGTRPTAQIGVAKGSDGFWYACVLYH
jgi:hypothetical protein